MTICEVTVSSGKTFNHPTERYANLRTQITIKANLLDDDDWITASRILQAEADKLADEHQSKLIDDILAADDDEPDDDDDDDDDDVL